MDLSTDSRQRPQAFQEEVSRRGHRPAPARARRARAEAPGAEAPGPAALPSKAGLKGSIGEGSNHSNFSKQSSVKILLEYRRCC